jgi:hypothetical protein
MKPLARIVSRGKITGLFIPVGEGLPQGVYEVREILGELQIVRVGDAAMPEARFTSLGLDELFAERFSAAMTTQELQSTGA